MGHGPEHTLYTRLRIYIWLSAKRWVCNGWLGCAENKRCLKKIFCHECGLNVCENEWGYSWNNCSRNFEAVWEICVIKCDFTAEIQPRKTDSGTEPVSVGAVWLKKTRKSYIYHTNYVSERSFYKIHESERLPLNYAFVKSISDRLIGRHLCRNTKRELSTPDWKQLWPLTCAEMTSYARQTRGQSLGSFEKI